MPDSADGPHGTGRPRLIFAFGGIAPVNSEQRQFELGPGVTSIGSSADAELSLDGLDVQHAEIRRDAQDEYVYADLDSTVGSRVNGQPVGVRELHTGDRIEFGAWTVSFYREEYADHGRPGGGRQ